MIFKYLPNRFHYIQKYHKDTIPMTQKLEVEAISSFSDGEQQQASISTQYQGAKQQRKRQVKQHKNDRSYKQKDMKVKERTDIEIPSSRGQLDLGIQSEQITTEQQLKSIAPKINKQPPTLMSNKLKFAFLIFIISLGIIFYLAKGMKNERNDEVIGDMNNNMTKQQNEIDEKNQKVQIINKNQTNQQTREDKGKIQPAFNIKQELSSLIPIVDGMDLRQYGIDKDIQIGSKFDYLNITKSQQFAYFKQNWQNSIKSQIYSFDFDNALQQSQYTKVINYTQFNSQVEISKYLQQLNSWNHQRNYGSDLSLYMASHILWNSTNEKLKQAQLFYLQNKYNISKYQQQLPICLFSTGYKIYSRNRHQYFLQSIEQQNYTNFHIVAVDDGSPDSTAQQIHKYLQNLTMRVKNKIKIVQNLQNMGATATTYYWSKKLCNQGDIIVHVDMDDMLLGRQVFKVINAIYHNPNIWYAYTRYLRQDNPEMLPNAGKSRKINIKIEEYRHALDWKTSAIRTLRYEVMSKVPLQHLVEYQYNQSLGEFEPKFYDTDADRFLIYSQLELCGANRIQYIDDVFYYYNVTNNIGRKCNMHHQHFDQYKSRIKTPVKPLKSLSDSVQFFSSISIPMNVTNNLKDRYNKYMKCLQM